MIGKQFISAVLAEASPADLAKYGPLDHLFKASEADVYAFVKAFLKQYGKLPTAATIAAHTGEDLVGHSEPSAYYLDLMRLRFIEQQLKTSMKAASESLLPEKKDPEQALKLLGDTVIRLMAETHGHQVVDFRQAYGVILADYAQKFQQQESYGLRLGWPTFDTACGGLGKGDLLSLVGRPAAGKTQFGLTAAHHGWSHSANDPTVNASRLFVSMEMTTLKVQQRLAALQARVPASALKNAALTTISLKKLKEGLTSIQGFQHPFYIIDANLSATVEDIWLLARQLNPGAIFIDGAYLLKHPTERDRYRRVAENADLIKQELATIAPTVASWQFAKTAKKKDKKKSDEITIDDIGDTDAIARNSSIVLGLLQEDSVETIQQREVRILKGRDGESGVFHTRWDWQKMDFSEIQKEAVEDLQFL